MEKAENSTEQTDRPKLKNKRWFGKKEALALGAGLVIAITAYALQDKLGDLRSLGYLGAFILLLITSATIILPAPGLIVVFGMGAAGYNPLILGIAAGLGSALGELSGYMAGYSSNRVVTGTSTYKRLDKYIADHSASVIFLLAFIPNPVFDLAGIAAGALRYSWQKFLLATAAGKIAKCILVAAAGSLSLHWIQDVFL